MNQEYPDNEEKMMLLHSGHSETMKKCVLTTGCHNKFLQVILAAV